MGAVVSEAASLSLNAIIPGIIAKALYLEHGGTFGRIWGARTMPEVSGPPPQLRVQCALGHCGGAWEEG